MADEAPKTEAAAPEVPEQTGAPKMSVKVYAPFQVYFEGDALSLSAVNAVGPFDILPRHHNFLCMLVPGNLVIQPVEGEKKVIKISRALMHVKADHVTVFMDV
jgi:F0F1-type ATP synthase epsilon subunit